MRHIPVLLTEVIAALNLAPGASVIDGTLGDAGHAEVMLEQIAPNGRLLGLDADPESLLRAKHFLHLFGDQFVGVRENFRNM